MGRHSNEIERLDQRGVQSRQTSRAMVRRPRSRSRFVLSVFAFVAVAGFMMVNVTDPYAGATASPYYQAAGSSWSAEDAQRFAAEASIELSDVQRDKFTVTEAPEPEPTVAAADGSSADIAALPSVTPDPGSAQDYAAGAVAARGWGADQFDCLVALWNRESGWRVNAANPSGAYGIPQALPGSKMSSAGADWATNAGTQIEWGLGYISSRYGSPCGAWQSSEERGWY